jgi:hypothetical protein
MTLTWHRVIAVGSPWNIGYNDELWERVVKGIGFRPINGTEEKGFYWDHCFWQNQVKVNHKGVRLANIDYYFNTKDFQSGKEKHTKPYRLSENLEAALVSEIKLIYPWREILTIVLCSVGGSLLLLGIALCCLRLLKKRRSRVSDGEMTPRRTATL